MLKYRLRIINSILLGTILFLGGCNFPVNSQEQATPEAVYTQAAETIIAQLTELAAPASEPSQPATPVSSSTVSTKVATIMPIDTATPTGTASPTVTPTNTITTTPTQAAQDPKASLGDPEWQEGFNNEENWALYKDEYVSFQITDGALVMQTMTSDSRDSWLLTWPDPKDYYLEAVMQTEACGGMNRYGVIFRTDADTGYLYGFTCDGQYSLRKWDGEQFSALIDWTYSPNILAGEGQVNRMGLWVAGSQFKLYANGTYLDQAEDNSFDEGSFGLFIGSQNGEGFTVYVDEIAYWDLP